MWQKQFVFKDKQSTYLVQKKVRGEKVEKSRGNKCIEKSKSKFMAYWVTESLAREYSVWAEVPGETGKVGQGEKKVWENRYESSSGVDILKTQVINHNV